MRPADRKALVPLARNAFRKLRALRHPNILKFLDGSESDSAIWIVTEPVQSLATVLESAGTAVGLAEESKVYGLLHVASALAFLNREGQSVHGGLRTTSVWVTPGGEWKLGGMEVCSRLDEPDAAMWVSRRLRTASSRSFLRPLMRVVCSNTVDCYPTRRCMRVQKFGEAAGPP